MCSGSAALLLSNDNNNIIIIMGMILVCCAVWGCCCCCLWVRFMERARLLLLLSTTITAVICVCTLKAVHWCRCPFGGSSRSINSCTAVCHHFVCNIICQFGKQARSLSLHPGAMNYVLFYCWMLPLDILLRRRRRRRPHLP